MRGIRVRDKQQVRARDTFVPQFTSKGMVCSGWVRWILSAMVTNRLSLPLFGILLPPEQEIKFPLTASGRKEQSS
jgi:hypothetical protein